MMYWLISNGSNSATRHTPKLRHIYQITAAGVFFPAMHATQFLKLSTFDSFSRSGSHIPFKFPAQNWVHLKAPKILFMVKHVIFVYYLHIEKQVKAVYDNLFYYFLWNDFRLFLNFWRSRTGRKEQKEGKGS